jgi:hypothetical protein
MYIALMIFFRHRRHSVKLTTAIAGLVCISALAVAQEPSRPDTAIVFTSSRPNLVTEALFEQRLTAWGFDLLISENGFGLGGFYRREFTDDLAGTVTFGISDVKDDGEIEYINYYGQSYVPGKKNRLIMLPLMASVQYRLFRDDIVDNFRPYVTAGAGPTTLFVSPYARITDYGGGAVISEKIDFFESLKYGKAHTTLGGFIGAGAYFGRDRTNVMGLSLRYYFIPVPSGIEVMQGGYVKEFGGVYITLHFGSAS